MGSYALSSGTEGYKTSRSSTPVWQFGEKSEEKKKKIENVCREKGCCWRAPPLRPPAGKLWIYIRVPSGRPGKTPRGGRLPYPARRGTFLPHHGRLRQQRGHGGDQKEMHVHSRCGSWSRRRGGPTPG